MDNNLIGRRKSVTVSTTTSKCNALEDSPSVSTSKSFTKWESMAHRGFEWFLAAHPTTLLRRLRRGAPQQYRWTLWKLILRSRYVAEYSEEGKYPSTRLREPPSEPDGTQGGYFSPLTNLTMGDYLALAGKQSSFTKQIKIDVPRTFPGINDFASLAHEQLGRILNAYGNYEPEVGYCQGINFVAGFLLLVSDFRELEAFEVLVSFMSTYGASGLYRENFPLLRRYLEFLESVMDEMLPALQKHLVNEGVLPPMYLHQWFLTLFIRGLPLRTTVVLWDYIIAEGLHSLITIAVVLLKVLERFLLKLAFEEAAKFLKSLQRSGSCDERRIGRMLVREASNLAIPEKFRKAIRKLDEDLLPEEYSTQAVISKSARQSFVLVNVLDSLADELITNTAGGLHQLYRQQYAVEEDEEEECEEEDNNNNSGADISGLSKHSISFNTRRRSNGPNTTSDLRSLCGPSYAVTTSANSVRTNHHHHRQQEQAYFDMSNPSWPTAGPDGVTRQNPWRVTSTRGMLPSDDNNLSSNNIVPNKLLRHQGISSSSQAGIISSVYGEPFTSPSMSHISMTGLTGPTSAATTTYPYMLTYRPSPSNTNGSIINLNPRTDIGPDDLISINDSYHHQIQRETWSNRPLL